MYLFKMKKIFYGIALACVLGLTSCDESARLAKSIEGTWSGAPEQFVNEVGTQATMVETIAFERDSTSKSGDVLISSIVSSTHSIPGDSSVVAPFSVTAAAKSYIMGKWQVIDDDEVVLQLDPASMVVSVDPDAVLLSANVLSGSTASDTEALKPQVMEIIKSKLTVALQAHYFAMRHLDDVKVKDGSTLKFEVAKTDYVFMRQGVAPQ